jgi:hypothetical protein
MLGSVQPGWGEKAVLAADSARREAVPMKSILLISKGGRSVVLLLGLLLIAFLLSLFLSRFSVLKSETTWTSWYGGDFHGRPTASGRRYDMLKLTAAHRTFPLGSRVRVVDPNTDRGVIVRITDRGPYRTDAQGKAVRPLQPHPRRGLDLSYGAARKLGVLESGVKKVRVEYLGK